MNKYNLTISCLIVSLTINIFTVKAQQSDEQHLETAKNLDVFNSLFKELSMFYVDSVDAKKSVQTAINSMLGELDPYTEYYPEDKINDLKYLTTGEYAGIGALILSQDGKIIISEPYENMPAALNGLQAGDEILEIDGESLEGKNSGYVSDRLRGQVSTVVKIKYLRPGEKKPVTIDIERKRVHINSITHYGVMRDSIGYIYLSAFTENTAQDIRAALDDLKANHHIKSLLLDLRDNGGGLMDDAIQLVNMFVPKGEIVVSTKGKTKQWDRTYRATQHPIDDKIPLLVLVNGQSASSSEIVAGALQDLDRAVLVGSRTYGKGLVQSTREVAYNGHLKLTISKYYIPSGRCIQAIDYTHRKEDGSPNLIPDSLTNTFYTSKKRPVKDGGGITPDFVVEEKRIPNIIYYLATEFMFFDFATDWKNKNKTIPPVEDFTLTDSDYESFKNFVKSKDFNYDRQSEKVLSSLKEVMEFEGYMSTASEELKALETKLKPDLARDLDKYKAEISKQLASEIVKRYYFQRGEIIQSLKDDDQLEKALEIVSNRDLYNQTLKLN